MTDVRVLFRRAVDEFDRRIHIVAADQWESPTPCSEWNVRDLVNHIVSEDLWAPPLLAGNTLEEVGDRFDGDVLGADPLAAWTAARDGALEAVDGPTDRQVHTSMGMMSAELYLGQLWNDHLIHAWDLARGIGADEHLDEELVELAYATAKPMEPMLNTSGVFGDHVEPPPDADLQSKLLAVFGRRA